MMFGFVPTSKSNFYTFVRVVLVSISMVPDLLRIFLALHGVAAATLSNSLRVRLEHHYFDLCISV
jgi:hypothetical protein